MKTMFRYFIMLMLLLVSLTVLSAEEEEKSPALGFFARLKEKIEEIESITDSYIVSSQGIAYTAIQDTRMTPMVHRAPGLSTFVQRRTYRPKEMLLTTVNIQFLFPFYEPNNGFDLGYYNPRMTIDFAYLRRIKELPLRVGGSINATLNMRMLESLGNSALNFDAISSINVLARWDDTFTLLKRPASWHVQASLPLFSMVVRVPAYNISYAGEELIWAAPWTFYRIRLNAGLTRLMDNSKERSLSIDYNYDFYGLAGATINHNLNIGLHSLTVGYALKLK